MTVVRFDDEEAWRMGRRIGSSDVAAVLGRSPFADATPFTVWDRIVNRSARSGESRVQQRGHDLEPVVLRRYARRFDVELEVPAPFTTFTRAEHSSSTPDARAGGRLVEGKTSVSRDGWGPDGLVVEEWARGTIPAHYYLQVQHQAWVLDVGEVDVAALFPAREPFGDVELRVYTVRAAPAVQARMIARLEEFWTRYVVPARPPPLDASAAASRWLAAQERDGRREATASERMLVAQHSYAASCAKAWKERRDMLGSLLVGAMGDQLVLDFPGGYVRAVVNHGRDVVNHRELLEAHPELRAVVEQYTRHTDGYAYPKVVLTKRGT